MKPLIKRTTIYGAGHAGVRTPYMTRWVLKLGRLGCLRLHHIHRPDIDDEHHDHPFSFLSWVVRGWYVEEIGGCRERIRRGLFSIAWRHHSCAHRIVEISPGGVWTLLWTTPKADRDWGFYTPRGWVPWREFVVDPVTNETKD